MNNINISLPKKLKEESEKLVKTGYYASFSDLVRSSLRKTIEASKYDLWADEAKEDYIAGRAFVLKDKDDIKKLLHRSKNV
ncbi:hypothetical protein COV24_05085 [candidate division WWE3 bacterium CG10_big_fil_rev_8_21_14_0_10_32_10]|uniref:CopG family transcriptional regulator n=1 Tax=candidate division WWE3 bacterium CG10_big_fil_rev_8_21_14_0_10_32_10 TaxID=1975090 RepID=A0A2H0R901_UNCKA|nr:MAG: hypothetical protein COV24_05085 [candidate division WWE3 bacterium CG10_big_fil_rev_8_21_14_0_10_32_10]